MDKFQVIQPSALLSRYVKQYWFLTMENVRKGSQRLVPFGSAALTFQRGDRTYSSKDGTYLPVSYLSGITTSYTDLTFSGRIDFIGIVFQPAGAHAFFRMPFCELRERPVSLYTWNDPDLLTLEQQLNETEDEWSCIEMIEHFLMRRIYSYHLSEDKRIDAVLDSIRGGEANLKRLAETACLGYKQFKRMFTKHIGTNPKDFLQIVRFQKLHHLLQCHTDKDLPQLAYECGYYDKSHLIKELREFSGFTPTQLLAACDPVYSVYHALFRSAFIDLPSG